MKCGCSIDFSMASRPNRVLTTAEKDLEDAHFVFCNYFQIFALCSPNEDFGRFFFGEQFHYPLHGEETRIGPEAATGPVKDFGRLSKYFGPCFQSTFQWPVAQIEYSRMCEKCFENTVRDVCSAVQNLRLGSIKLLQEDSINRNIASHCIAMQGGSC